MTAVSPLTERDLTYVRSARELGAGNGPTFLFLALKPSSTRGMLTALDPDPIIQVSAPRRSSPVAHRTLLVSSKLTPASRCTAIIAHHQVEDGLAAHSKGQCVGPKHNC